MKESTVVRFVIPSDAKHVSPQETHFACACPDCLQLRGLAMVWPLTRFVVIVAEGHYGRWLDKELELQRKDDVPDAILDRLLERNLIGVISADLNWPTAKYMAYRRKELYLWLNPIGVSVPSPQ